jgi:carbonic anhydrase
MSVLGEVLKANAAYAADFGEKANLAIPPARHFTILTCMDARLDPAKYAGLSEGDAHIIRNAGGRASDDALRSLVISYKLLGTNEFLVIHHTDCGMLFFTDEVMRNLLASSLETAELTPNGFRDIGKGSGSTEGEFIDWLTMKDNAAGVIADVRRIRSHPLIPKSIRIYGIYLRRKKGDIGGSSGSDGCRQSRVTFHNGPALDATPDSRSTGSDASTGAARQGGSSSPEAKSRGRVWWAGEDCQEDSEGGAGGGVESGCEHSGGFPRTRSAAFSAIINTQALMLPETRSGMAEASATRSPSTPRTRSAGSSTASPPSPIAQVAHGW